MSARCGSLVAIWVATLIAALLPQSPAASAATLATWIQLVGPGRTAQIRVVTDSRECPALQADGKRLEMHVRAGRDPLFPTGNVPKAKFPVLVCEVQAPGDKAVVSLDGKPLPLPRLNPQRIVIFGDTGCRIDAEKGKKPRIQNCKTDWPFAEIAQHAADARPDLVIHVGDYIYRESECPPKDRRCRNSPTGYGWDVWASDFFQPSMPLLAAAPWIMVRGNHENCDKAAEGWFRFFDPSLVGSRCAPFTGFFAVNLGDIGFVVMDSADLADAKPGEPALVGEAEVLEKWQAFRTVANSLPPSSWLLTHRPFNAVRQKEEDSSDKSARPPTIVDNHVLQHAIGGQLPVSIKMIVAGHIHMFEAVSFEESDPRPAQLVVGTGGDWLGEEPVVPESINNARVAPPPTVKKLFGYTVWDRTDAGWNAALFSQHGILVARCSLSGVRLTCEPA